MIDGLIIALELPFLLFVIRRAGVLPFPTGAMAYLLFSQTVFILYGLGLVQYDFLEAWTLGGTQQYSTQTLILYAVIFFAAPLSCHGHFTSLRTFKGRLAQLRTMLRGGSRSRMFFIFATFGLLLHTILWMAFLDVGNWWHNYKYLTPLGRAEMAAIPLAKTIYLSAPFISMLCSSLFIIAIFQRSPGFASIFGALMLLHFITFLGMHSRASVLTPAVAGALWWLLSLRFRKPIVAGCFVVAFICLSYSLVGRALDEHGVSTIPATLTATADAGIGGNISTVSTNIAEGIFVVAEGFMVQHNYGRFYKMLCFSPLPSIIDGYATILRNYQVRISFFVPVSGITEAMNFGLMYLLLLAGIYYGAIRLNLMFIKRNPLLFLICNFLIFFSLYHILDYPLRNGLKYLWMSVYLSLIAMTFSLFFKGHRNRMPKRVEVDRATLPPVRKVSSPF